MENCDKCGQTFELHTLDDKLVRLICACEKAKKCYKKTCEAAVTQAELIAGAPSIVKSYRCDEHGFEELKIEAVPVATIVTVPVEVPVVVETPVAAPAEPGPPQLKPLTQGVAENCFAVIELEVVAAAVNEGEVDTCYRLTSRSVPPMTQVTCVKCSDSHTLRSRTPVVVVDEKTNIGLHRTICPKCDECSLFVIAPARTL